MLKKILSIWTASNLSLSFTSSLASMPKSVFILLHHSPCKARSIGISLGPFSISYLEAQVTRNCSSKSLDRFLSSLQVTWKPSHFVKSQVTSFADFETSWVALIALFVFCIFLIHICDISWYVIYRDPSRLALTNARTFVD